MNTLIKIEDTTPDMRRATMEAAIASGWSYVKIGPRGQVLLHIDGGMPIDTFFGLCEDAIGDGETPNKEFFSRFPELFT